MTGRPAWPERRSCPAASPPIPGFDALGNEWALRASNSEVSERLRDEARLNVGMTAALLEVAARRLEALPKEAKPRAR